MGVGLELIAFLVTSLLGGIFPLLKDIAKSHLKQAKANGKTNKFDRFLERFFKINRDLQIH
jgi:hypothetical protein